MNVNDAIKETARAVRDGRISASACDIRYTINDLVPYDSGYNQERAITRVRNLVAKADALD